MSQRHAQTGMALIIAMVILALATVAAISFTGHQQRDIRRTQLLLNRDQALNHALGVEAWAIGLLSADASESSADHLSETWAQPMPVEEIPGGRITGRILDLQGRFNLNNLVLDTSTTDSQASALSRLLETLQLSSLPVAAVSDWADADSDTGFPDGAEDSIYQQLDPPLLAANQALVEITELQPIWDLDPGSQRQLYPLVTAIPASTTLNINTAPPEVIAAALPELSSTSAESLAERLRDEGFASREEMLNHPLLKGHLTTGVPVDVTSAYFLVEAQVELDDSRLTLFSMLHRSEDGQVSVIRRKLIGDLPPELPEITPEN